MKKKTVIAAGLTATMTLGLAAGVYASGQLTQVKAFLNPSVNISIGGSQVELNEEDGSALTPLIYNNRTYLPVRSVAGQFGYDVYWEGSSQTAYFTPNSEFLEYRMDEQLILDKYGYSLQIPASFGGKLRPTVWPAESIADGMKSGALSANALSAIDLLYLPQDAASPEARVIATVEVVDQAKWNAADGHDAIDSVLGTKGEYVYVLRGAKENPFGAGTADNAGYKEIVEHLSARGYDLVLSPAALASADIVSKLVGSWTESRKGTVMELTADGVFYRAGQPVGNYLIMDSSHIRIVADKSVSTVEFIVNGDTLEMAGQTFTRNK
ncbi:stalk domain-containing protein [Paenibacillus sp. BC26]|uniref:stalk domain-containing protein n=1 Tax=Paenibacillus sp. BC26 TaxID=1881032 RepID=UPI0008E234BF|nr:stalk domain-containing protein [Paenibacillus sp. BC26]SFT05441.1 Copper amine oxidase N-terminal domain-containing protein [Paenibacillus sp. BC26]